jgi:Flp pilus assembly protein TadB
MTWILLFLGAISLSWGLSRLLADWCYGQIRRALRRSPRRLRALGPLLRATSLAILLGGAAAGVGMAGSPLYGLGFAFLVPAALRLVVRWAAERQAAALDGSAIAYFRALRGLIRSGLGLPYAIFRLAEAVPSPFSEAMRPFLGAYAAGRPLADCLDRFRGKMDLRLTGICLTVLQTAYREGLPIGPFLDRMLPLLESEQRGRARIASLRRSIAVQALVAALTPPLLAVVLHAFQPEVGAHFAGSRAGRAVIGLALGMELCGTVVLWKVSSFY